MKNNKNAKRTPRDRNEKRRLTFEKKKATTYITQPIPYDANAFVAVKRNNYSQRLIAVLLALAFIVTSFFVGITVKAVTGSQKALDGNYEGTFTSSNKYRYSNNANKAASYKTSITIADGVITAINVECTNLFPNSGDGAEWNKNINKGIAAFLNGVADPRDGVNARAQLIGQPATEDMVKTLTYENGSRIVRDYTYNMFYSMKQSLIAAINNAPGSPKEHVVIDDDDEYIPELPPSVENSLELDKRIAPSADGKSYDLTLEAYSTADLGEYDVVEKIPTDFVVIVDQSGSMATSDMPTSYKGAGNHIPLETIANGHYYYMDEEGNTYRVFAERGYLYEYQAPNTLYPYDVIPQSAFGWFKQDEDVTFNVTNAYFYKEGNNFHQLHYEVSGRLLRYHVAPSYANNAGGTTTITAPAKPVYKNVIDAAGDIEPGTGVLGGDSALYTAVNGFCKLLSSTAYTYAQITGVPIAGDITTGMYFDFPMYKRHVGYTRLCYRDNAGVIHEIPSDTGETSAVYCNSNGTAIRSTSDNNSTMNYTGLLEMKESETRLQALNTALKDFIKTLQAERDTYGPVDNKVSIVGFSSFNGNPDIFENTELLSGVPLVNKPFESSRSTHYSLDGLAHNGIPYSNEISASTYNSTLLSPNEQQQDLMNAVNAVTAYGGTQPEDGFAMAKHVLESRENKTFTFRSPAHEGETVDRNKIVIFFTDGEPGDNDAANRYVEANEVIAAAKEVKDYQDPNGTKPTVFSIGVFGNSDGEPLKYWAHPESVAKNDENKYDAGWFDTYVENGNYYYLNRYWMTGDTQNYGEQATDTIYDYMSVVSSNHPNATGFVTDSWARTGKDGTKKWINMIDQVRGAAPETNEYYRMAANQETLINAFRNAIRVESTEAETMEGVISPDSTLKDVVDLTNFDIPTGPDGKPSAPVTIKMVLGTRTDNETPISFAGTPVDVSDNVTYEWGEDNKTLMVKGFDYNANYIAQGHDGYKLIVTIEGLTPKDGKTGNQLTSNKNSSGVYESNDPSAEMLKDFPVPSISRHKYTLTVEGDNPEATLSAQFNLVGEDGSTALTQEDLSNAIIQTGTARSRLTSSTVPWASVGTGTVMYLENLPTNAKLNTTMQMDDQSGAYTYSLQATETEDSSDITGANLNNNSYSVNYKDSDFVVSSVANNRTVTLKETVGGSFSDDGDSFRATLTLTPPSGTEVSTLPETLDLGNNVTATLENGVYTAQVEKQGDGTVTTLSIPYGYTLSVSNENISNPHYNVDSILYGENGGTVDQEYPSTGKVINNDTDIIIHNVCDNIPATGMEDDSSSMNSLVLVFVVMSAVIASGTIAFGKRRNNV